MAVRRHPRERLRDHVGERLRDRRVGLVGARDRFLEDRARGEVVARALEQALVSGELVEHDAEREHVAAAIERLPEQLLGGHVLGLALDRTDLGLGRAADLRDAEVEDLGDALGRDEQVRG